VSPRLKGSIVTGAVGLVVGLLLGHLVLGCGGAPFTEAPTVLSADVEAGIAFGVDAGGELGPDASPVDDARHPDAGDAQLAVEASVLEDARPLDAGDEASTRDAELEAQRDAVATVDAPVEAPPPMCDVLACAACSTPWVRCCASSGHCGCSLSGAPCQ
jgi:hypothetical protein